VKEILTNEEIDALLDLFKSEGAPDEEEFLQEEEGFPGRGVWSGDSGPAGGMGPAPRKKRVHKFDLFRPNRFTREQIQYLEKLQEVAALGLTSTLTERLGLGGLCECVLVEQQRFGPFLSSLRSPLALYTLELRPSGGRALLAVSCSLLFTAIERIMGGAGEPRDEERDLTEVEYAVVEDLVTHMLQDISGGFAELVEMDMEILARPRNLALAQVVGTQDVVLCVHFQVSGENLAGDIRLAIPHESLAPYLEGIDQAGGGQKTGAESFREAIKVRLHDAGVKLSVELGKASIRLRDLMELRKGDLLVLDTRLGDPVVVPVEGKPKFQGVLGVRGRRLAVKVTRALEAGGTEGG